MTGVALTTKQFAVSFGQHVKALREAKKVEDPEFSVRKFAGRLGIEPSYLSRVENEGVSPPGESVIVAMAEALGEHPDVLLALAGKVSKRLQAIIVKRPKLIAELLEQVEQAPDEAVIRVVREVRDGKW